MSIVGLPLTLMAIVAVALLALAIRHPGRATERQLVALLPLAALAGVLYFATAYPTPDGDTVKGSFMLTAVPAWAACFGFAFDEVRRRFPRGSVALLLGLAALALAAPRSCSHPATHEPAARVGRLAIPASRIPGGARIRRRAARRVDRLPRGASRADGALADRPVSSAREAPERRSRARRSRRAFRSGGALATRVEGNGVHVAIATSDAEAAALVPTYLETTGRNVETRLERRGRVVYLWERAVPLTRRRGRRCTTAGTSDVTERRAAQLGIIGALAVVVGQLCVDARAGRSRTTIRRRSSSRAAVSSVSEEFAVEPTSGDAVAESAGGGTLRTIVEGNLVTLSVAAEPCRGRAASCRVCGGRPDPARRVRAVREPLAAGSVADAAARNL